MKTKRSSNRKLPSVRNLAAKNLSSPIFKNKIVQSKKVYKRKKDVDNLD